MTSQLLSELQRVADSLRAATRVVVFTGAGISAESGIPTFRDAQTGLWARFRPEDLASRAAFDRDPVTVWEWYRWRRELVDAAQPNAGHRAIAELQQRVTNTVVITQNVDGLHRAAGAQDVIELHGSIHRARCPKCAAERSWAPDEGLFPPLCVCHAMMRPDIVWFGEMLPQALLTPAFEAAESCEVFLSVGTSNLVQPAASLPWLAAKRGALVAVVNTDMDGQPLTENVVHLTGNTGEILPRLMQLAFPEST
ncbi:MAG: SIR2 family NAD-dependent protein deacylase [Gemmatimonadaceae bacterium]